MVNNKTNQLKSKLESLPVFEPNDSLWNEIENRLDFDNKLSSIVSDMPNYDPKQDLWDSINEKLDSTNKPKTKHFKLYQLITAAASILLLISFSIHLTSNNKKQYLIETEFVINDDFKEQVSTPNEENALKLIEEMCENNLPQCNSDIFREKVGLYNELDIESVKLESVIASIGESPEIIKAMIRIENMKSQTIQELITLVNS